MPEKTESKLRTLRQVRKQTIEGIAAEAEITYKTLSEIERGITRQPSREILYKILEVLDQYAEVSTEDRQAIFVSYGYKKPYPLPTKTEIEFARRHWREVYGQIPYPAYLVDFSQRLLDWNRYTIRLLGMRYNDPRLSFFQNVTIFDVTFKLASSLVEILNRDEYISDLVRTMKAEFEPYKDEPWCAECINQARMNYPDFRNLWDSFSEKDLPLSGMGNTVPIILRVPQEGKLKFQLSRIIFAADPRFFIVQWIPIDEVTMVKCLVWKQEDSDTLY